MDKNIVWHEHTIQKTHRAQVYGQKPCIIWLTGLSGSGKSTIANALEKKLFKDGFKTYLLDGDNVRHGINQDLGFSNNDRIENIRRVGEVAKLFVDAGLIVICAFISPFSSEREFVRNLVGESEFIEIFVNTPLEVCEQRDTKGLYKKARNGEVKDFTGIDSSYEVPKNPEMILDTTNKTIQETVETIYKYSFIFFIK